MSIKLKYTYFLLFLLVMPSAVWPSQNETIPTYHWAYADLSQLRLHGYLTGLFLSNQPFTKGEVARTLIQLKTRVKQERLSLDPTSSAIVNRLEIYLGPEIAQIEKKGETAPSEWLAPGERLRIGAIVEQDFVHRKNFSKFRGIYRSQIDYSPIPDITAFNTINFDQYLGDDPTYTGKRWRGITGYTEQAYIRAFLPIFPNSRQNGNDRRSLWVMFGRDFLKWGPGVTGQLYFSDAARPMDQFSFRYRNRWLQYTFVTAQLENFALPDSFRRQFQTGVAHRFLSAHRLDMRFKNRIYFGISEGVLYGGPDEYLNFAYLNPMVFYHGEQLNKSGSGNTMGSVDISIYPGRKVKLYGTLLIDDIQLEKTGPGDLEPGENGWLTGIQKADPFGLNGLFLGAEYVKIKNRTYKTAHPWEWWEHWHKPLGYYLGSDLDHLMLQASYWSDKNFVVDLQWHHIRRGEGRLSKPWDQPWMSRTLAQGYHEKFPTGIVETTSRLTLNFRYFFRTNFQLVGNLSAYSKKNVDNVAGADETGREGKVGIWWEGRF
ncbi:hypothetical protein BMS3Bbin03_00672 [bacterium BMS3Bbin03]|nr:hypothetical protein BMS3Bbin03_00672 [bacterium BMS3Bbin03]